MLRKPHFFLRNSTCKKDTFDISNYKFPNKHTEKQHFTYNLYDKLSLIVTTACLCLMNEVLNSILSVISDIFCSQLKIKTFTDLNFGRNGASLRCKGQLISKCLFCVFNSPKKQTKTI